MRSAGRRASTCGLLVPEQHVLGVEIADLRVRRRHEQIEVGVVGDPTGPTRAVGGVDPTQHVRAGPALRSDGSEPEPGGSTAPVGRRHGDRGVDERVQLEHTDGVADDQATQAVPYQVDVVVPVATVSAGVNRTRRAASVGMSLAAGRDVIVRIVLNPTRRNERSTRNQQALDEPYPWTSTIGVAMVAPHYRPHRHEAQRFPHRRPAARGPRRRRGPGTPRIARPRPQTSAPRSDRIRRDSWDRLVGCFVLRWKPRASPPLSVAGRRRGVQATSENMRSTTRRQPATSHAPARTGAASGAAPPTPRDGRGRVGANGGLPRIIPSRAAVMCTSLGEKTIPRASPRAGAT